MPGTEVGSGWTLRAVISLVEERFGVSYRPRGMQKILRRLSFSLQRGRPFYHRRTAAEQARFECETPEVLADCAQSGARVVPLAGDQTRVYLEGTVGKRWSRRGHQPRLTQASRRKYAENIYGAVHLGTGEEVAPFSIDFQDADATIRWFELVKEACPRGQLVVWLDSAPHLVHEEVEEWLAGQPRLRVIRFPAKRTRRKRPGRRSKGRRAHTAGIRPERVWQRRLMSSISRPGGIRCASCNASGTVGRRGVSTQYPNRCESASWCAAHLVFDRPGWTFIKADERQLPVPARFRHQREVEREPDPTTSPSRV